MGRRSSLVRILTNDWPALSMAIATGFWWVAMTITYLAVRGAEGSHVMRFQIAFGIVTFLITASCGGFSVWRIWVICWLFRHGTPTSGWIVRVGQNLKQIRFVVVAYDYNGREYQRPIVVEAADDPDKFLVSHKVDLLVDPQKPRRVIMPEIYR